MRRRRRPGWFPTIGVDQSESDDNWNARAFSLNGAPNGLTSIIIFPVIPDVQVDGDSFSANDPGQLVQAMGQSYELERIVGKIFLGCGAPRDDNPAAIFPKVAYIGAGFFVARQADNNVGGGPNIPVGSASAAEAVENYSPLSEDTVREPWIWHRTWLISSGRNINDPDAQSVFTPITASTGSETFGGPTVATGLPTTNVGMGTYDGPHIDARSGRRVDGDERLWCAVAARSADSLLGMEDPNTLAAQWVRGILQIRVLGFLRKTAVNRSTF